MTESGKAIDLEVLRYRPEHDNKPSFQACGVPCCDDMSLLQGLAVHNRQTGSMVIRPRFPEGDVPFSSRFSDGLAAVRIGGKWDFIDRHGTVVISPMFSGDEYSPPRFSEGLCVIREGSKYGYIDTTGKFAIAPKFDRAWNFSEGAALVQEGDGTQVFIDKKGDHIGTQRFSSA